ncbi:CLUMA_CG003603, isoform A [Clunio marinus]|uniref:Pyruvate kinase n=1 Tax=Clunio marinus TaxID=568069 RepID=A0A1J1HT80_9DIPT|nr:CLUMA_CG003603, isoform A [Clunio marinus]
MKAFNFICTIAPENNSIERIERMIYKGMSVARLNLTHGTHESHFVTITNVRLAAERYFVRTSYVCPLAIAFDLRGPEMRTGEIIERDVKIGESVTLSCSAEFLTKPDGSTIYVDFPIARKVKKDQVILIDDGSVALSVDCVLGDNIMCLVRKGGILKSFQTLYIPDIVNQLSQPFLSEKDKNDIDFAIEQNVQFLFASHVKDGDSIDKIREYLDDNSSSKSIKIYAKIQNQFAVDEIEEIITKFDGIIIAPTIAINLRTIPVLERLTLWKCKRKMKPFLLTVESELESAEIYQISNWSLQFVDGIILKRDACRDKFEAIQSLKVLQKVNSIKSEMSDEENEKFVDFSAFDFMKVALASSTVKASITSETSAIIIITNSSQLPFLVYYHHPKCLTIVIIEDEMQARQLNILNRLIPLIDNRELKTSKENFAVEFTLKSKITKPGDSIVILNDEQNSMTIHYIPYDRQKQLKF